jgi:hypothetical protein
MRRSIPGSSVTFSAARAAARLICASSSWLPGELT